MELVDLQRAAFGPTLWHRKINQHSTDRNTFPHVERPITCAPNPIQDAFFQDVFLVPGGRYLLSTTNTSIQLWDLGYKLDPSEPPYRLLVETKILVEGDEHDEFRIISAVPEDDSVMFTVVYTNTP